MLRLNNLKLRDFRCFDELSLDCGPGINIIEGLNGSGKTSLLEAIYFMNAAKSFRSRLSRYVVREGQDGCVIHAALQRGPSPIAIGIERSARGVGRIKLNGSMLQSAAPLAQQVPMMLIHPERLTFISAGPGMRRELLNWGLFYSEPEFYPTWQRVQKALKQRNSLLKQRFESSDLDSWDAILVQSAPQLDAMRSAYMAELSDQLQPLCELMFAEPLALSWSYQRGWPEGEDLQEVLRRHAKRDAMLGYTQYGPHRADFVLKSRGQPAHQVLSQGQQKNLAYAVMLAQMQLQMQRESAILLIDDLPAELDDRRIAMICEVIQSINAQTFITAIDSQVLPALLAAPHQLFHVEQQHDVSVLCHGQMGQKTERA